MFSCFGVDAMSKLVASNWPALKHLDLSENKLESAAIAPLVQVDRPLETLHPSNNTIDMEAMEHLVQGNWPRLRQLTLNWCRLNVKTVEVLAKVQWPLQQLDLSHNRLDANAMTQLTRGKLA